MEVENSLDGEWNLNIFKAKIRAHLRGEGKEKEKKKKDGKVKSLLESRTTKGAKKIYPSTYHNRKQRKKGKEEKKGCNLSQN